MEKITEKIISYAGRLTCLPAKGYVVRVRKINSHFLCETARYTD